MPEEGSRFQPPRPPASLGKGVDLSTGRGGTVCLPLPYMRKRSSSTLADISPYKGADVETHRAWVRCSWEWVTPHSPFSRQAYSHADVCTSCSLCCSFCWSRCRKRNDSPRNSRICARCVSLSKSAAVRCSSPITVFQSPNLRLEVMIRAVRS
jgi:hypothetical protein